MLLYEKTWKTRWKLLMSLYSPASHIKYTMQPNTRKNMDKILFKIVYCTVHLRGQIDTNCTWSQPQLLYDEVLQIAEQIDRLYNKHTSFTVCLVAGIKIELANSVPKSATTLLTTRQHLSLQHHCHPWLTPLTPGDKWRLHARRRDLHILFHSSPTASSLYTWADVSAPYASSLSVFIFPLSRSLSLSLFFFPCRTFIQPGRSLGYQQLLYIIVKPKLNQQYNNEK